MSNKSQPRDTPRDPKRIEVELDRTRGELSQTLDALQEKLSPGPMFDEALNYFRNSGGGEFASNFKHSITQNPVPVTLVGVGLAWLALAGRGGGSSSDPFDASGYDDPYHPHAEYPQDRPVAEAEGLEGVSGRTAFGDDVAPGMEPIGTDPDQPGRMRRMASGGRERMRGVTRGARQGISGAGAMGRRQAARAKSGFEYMLHEQPLVLGAIGVALGAALAAGLPGTRREDELMGGTRDQFMDKAQEKGKEQLGKAKQAAKSAGDAAKKEARKELDDTHRTAAPNEGSAT
ncbi:MAG: DUF3618 domain-containing protein [Gammaproteobacteria bacterium]